VHRRKKGNEIKQCQIYARHNKMRTFFISFAAANQHAVGVFKLFIYDFLFLLIENENSCYKFSTHKGKK